MKSPADNTCPNCSHPITTNFCEQCGNPRFKRIDFKEVLRDFFSNLVSLEGQLLHTVKNLSIRPGHFIKEYVEGVRVVSYKPFQYYLLMLSIYLVVYVFFGDDMYQYMKSFFATPVGQGSYQTAEELDNYQKINAQVQSLVNNNMKLFSFMQVPIWTFFIHDAYQSKKYNLSEILVFTLFILGHSQLIDLLTTPIIMLLSNGVYLSINLIFLFLLLVWASRQFFEVGWLRSVFSSLYVLIMGLIFMGVFAMYFAGLYILGNNLF